MKPPYEITTEILQLIASISEKTGVVRAKYLNKQSPQLRKKNKIRTIHSSLKIEGNSLSEEQVTAIIENKIVAGSAKDILEVTNAVEVYDHLSALNPLSEKSFLSAHKILMHGLVPDAGKYRKKGVGIVKGAQIKHLAPSFKNVPYLMKDLFNYVKKGKEIILIKSCVFHYEMEFIHPFMDGNGRMGRLWQTLLLLKEYPVFEFLPFETLISRDEKAYYSALSLSDQQGNSTAFIEYMLKILDKALEKLLDYNNRALKDIERLEYFIGRGKSEFSRKDYMNLFKEISPATASRDLKKGVDNGLFKKRGDKTKTIYKVIKN